MNSTSNLTTRVALGLAAAAALFALGGGAAYAEPTNEPGMVAMNLGSQDPRDTARSTAEVLGPVRTDGVALRAAFDDLAARAERSRQASSSGASQVISVDSGFSWRDAGIGGGIALLAVLLVGVGLAANSHRSKDPVGV